MICFFKKMLILSEPIPNKFVLSTKEFIFATYKIDKMNLQKLHNSKFTTGSSACKGFFLSSVSMCMR